jgi:hypothetical protein
LLVGAKKGIYGAIESERKSKGGNPWNIYLSKLVDSLEYWYFSYEIKGTKRKEGQVLTICNNYVKGSWINCKGACFKIIEYG